MASSPLWTAAMTPQDKVFYQQLGQRIAQLRKAQNLTQAVLAQALGIGQQTLAHYEVGRLRVPASLLPGLAQHLEVTVQELMGEEQPAAKSKRGPKSRLQRQIEQVTQLPRTKQRFVSDMIDTVLLQAER